uniref:Uncharacterized protein n=1 Tax=Oryza glumipatula TaxID=40148 RepID=A0A0E0AGG1_9ORYZ
MVPWRLPVGSLKPRPHLRLLLGLQREEAVARSSSRREPLARIFSSASNARRWPGRCRRG